ncbi:putative N-acetylated-alpha-linked acidic dipeptidase [Littorina saxatilis]|uniref:putative N-acetylated-alpha-linked acidic dipeptidase n=1 Tax=Littorina saxatilis TaxID=31220 RepID=UPI0038B64035
MPSHFDLDTGRSSKTATRSLYFYIAVAVVVGIAAFVIGILIGRFAACDESGGSSQAQMGTHDRITQEADPEISGLLINAVNNVNIENNLRRITEKPHIAGEQADFDLVTYLKDAFTSYGLDSVKAAPYDVLLSYPDDNNPNSVQLLDASGNVTFDSLSAESNISLEEGVVPPFNAYSPARDETGDLMYVNYGRVEDYVVLANKSVNVTGKIVIARYGKIFRGSKVDIAARHGARGIIIYSDPADYTWPEEDSRVFPDTVWLPPTAAQRGTIYTGDGDPLTPGYPSIRTAFRYPQNHTKTPLPAIPAHPIGYGAALHFLQELQGEEVPEDWRGGLNISYRFGPLTTGQVRMNITTRNSRRRADNVIAILKGAVEPDRYVLIGNHRDAWVYGSIDPSSATAVMLEVARAMGQLVKQGRWRPRRSIMFCSWGAEEYGLIGSTEWAEQYVKTLGARAVAYVNIDIAVQGNYSLQASATPLMYRTIFEASKKVPNPNDKEKSEGRGTVYDTWKHSFPWTGNDLPRVGSLGSGSDYAPLLQIIGITSVDFRYTYNTNKYKLGSYSLYHTEYETFETVKRLLDHDFTYHQAVGRVAVEMLRSLSDSLIIPFNVSDYVWGLENNRQQLDTDYGSLLAQHIDNYTNLETAIKEFAQDVHNFESAVAGMDKTDPMAIRMVNDQLLLLEKAFLDPSGLPDRPQKKHLLFAENANDVYAGSSFPGLIDLLFEIDERDETERQARWEEVRHQFSVIVNAIQAAGFTLRDVISFTEERY